MNKSMIVGVLLGVVGASAVGAIASYSLLDNDDSKTASTIIEEGTEPATDLLEEDTESKPNLIEKASNLLKKDPEFAEVLSVEPVTETYKVPRQECYDEVVTHTKPAGDKHQITGVVVGALVGGLLGKQVGGGNGKKLATVAGAAAGGFAGKKVQEDMQAKNTYTTTEQRCNTVVDTKVNTIGYDVRYKLAGKIDTVRTSKKPANTIPVENGELVLNQL